MTYLILDIGNQDTVIGALRSTKEVLFTARIPTHRRSVTEVEQFLDFVLRKNNLDRNTIKGLAGASVVPQANEIWDQACRAFLDKDPWWLRVQSVQKWMNVHVDHPDEVGPDRLANAAAVMGAHERAAAIVMDFGTATTFDVVTASNDYVGGLICPGIGLALETLGRSTALLPRVSFREHTRVIGKNTVDAMTSGVYWGYMAMVEGLLDRLTKEIEQDYQTGVEVFATGGNSEMICRHLSGVRVHLDPYLTLRGIYRAIERSGQKVV